MSASSEASARQILWNTLYAINETHPHALKKLITREPEGTFTTTSTKRSSLLNIKELSLFHSAPPQQTFKVHLQSQVSQQDVLYTGDKKQSAFEIVESAAQKVLFNHAHLFPEAESKYLLGSRPYILALEQVFSAPIRTHDVTPSTREAVLHAIQNATNTNRHFVGLIPNANSAFSSKILSVKGVTTFNGQKWIEVAKTPDMKDVTPDEAAPPIPSSTRFSSGNSLWLAEQQLFEEFNRVVTADDGDQYHRMLPDDFPPYQEWNTLSNVEKVYQDQNTFLFIINGVTPNNSPDTCLALVVYFLSPTVFRVRFNPRDLQFFNWEHSYAVKTHEISPVDVVFDSTNSDYYQLSTGALILQISKGQYKLKVFDNNFNLISEDADFRNIAYVQSSTGNFKVKPSGSFYYGFGEKAGLELEKSGQSMSDFNYDQYDAPTVGNLNALPMYTSIPFMIEVNPSKNYCYGLFLDNPGQTFFNMGAPSLPYPNQFYFGTEFNDLDYYFIYGGQQIGSIIQQYSSLLGLPPVPPLYALGYQQGCYGYSSPDILRQVAETYRHSGMPIDVLHIDIDIQHGFQNFTVNHEWTSTDIFKQLKATGFKTSTNITAAIAAEPFIDKNNNKEYDVTNYPALREGKEKDIFIRSSIDQSYFAGTVNYGTADSTGIVVYYPDFTPVYDPNYNHYPHPAVLEWWKKQYSYLFKSAPVDMIWQDMTCPANNTTPNKTIPLDTVQHDFGRGSDHAKIHNAYGLTLVESTYKVLQQLRPNARNFIIARGGYAGVGRVAALWTGDSGSDYANYQRNIIMVLNFGLSGVPITGSDIGGFAPPQPSIDLLARWMLMGAFLPWYRNHYFGHGKKQGQEPWQPMYAVAFADMLRYVQMRYRLLQYIYDYSMESHITGAPIARTIFYDNFSDLGSYNNDYVNSQFFLGRDILVAPFTSANQGDSRYVYTPNSSTNYYPLFPFDPTNDGTDRLNFEPFSTLESSPLLPPIPGGQILTYTPLNPSSNRWYVPFFVQEGAIIPIRPVMQWVGEKPAPLTLFVFPGPQHTKYTLNLDDGLTAAFATPTGHRRVTITKTLIPSSEVYNFVTESGSYLPNEEIFTVLLLGQKSTPSSVLLNGTSIQSQSSFDPSSQTVSIALKKPFAAAQFILTINH